MLNRQTEKKNGYNLKRIQSIRLVFEFDHAIDQIHHVGFFGRLNLFMMRTF